MLTHDRLKEVLDYDASTGIFTWKVTLSSRAPKGKVAGSLDKLGYLRIRIDNVEYKSHRLAWFYFYGTMPTKNIDHKNGVPNDNRISNLRDCTQLENCQNNKAKGVHYVKLRGNWQAKIMYKRKIHHLGTFKTEEEARAAYLEAKAKLHTFNPIQRT